MYEMTAKSNTTNSAKDEKKSTMDNINSAISGIQTLEGMKSDSGMQRAESMAQLAALIAAL